MNSKSENIKTMISDEADKVIKELFDSLKNRYKKKNFESIEGSTFFFSIIMSCTKYKRYSLVIKSKGIITIKHGAMQIQYP